MKPKAAPGRGEEIRCRWIFCSPDAGGHPPPAQGPQGVAVLDADVGVGSPPATDPFGHVCQVGKDDRGAIYLVEDGLHDRQGAWHIERVAVDRQVPIGRLDVGVGLQRADSPLQAGFNQGAADPVGDVALPGEEDVLGHGGDEVRGGDEHTSLLAA